MWQCYMHSRLGSTHVTLNHEIRSRCSESFLQLIIVKNSYERKIEPDSNYESENATHSIVNANLHSMKEKGLIYLQK